MAEGGTDRLTLLNWPSLLGFVLLSWGIVLLPPAMKSLRPTGEHEPTPTRAEGQLFEARLWQDPFDVLRAAQASKAKFPCANEALIPAKGTKGRLLILPVFLPGTDYPEDVETRLRLRNAVVSALAVSGYIPEDGGDIRCFSTPWPVKPAGTLDRVMPFEWYRFVSPETADKFPRDNLSSLTHIDMKGNSPDRVAVIWVDERLFDEDRTGITPATLLKQWAEPLNQKPRVSIALLGPQFSDTLKSMLLEEDKNAGADQGNRNNKIRIYSFSSTVEALRHPPPCSLLTASFELVHVIGTDRELADSIAGELKLRGIDPASPRSSIALVAEWDSYYSQSMFKVFSCAFGKSPRFFTYQQGIDGRLPRDRAEDASGAEKTDGASRGILPGGEPLIATPVVQAFGRSQVDYLQRLVDQMRRSDKSPWAAIGVLGNDFYDKILVLEALKHEFPDAVFFTTDLDQRYLDPAEPRTTRNLLVASHFGLELHEGLQRAIPPFRWVYQTALFLGCLKALRDSGVPPPAILRPETDKSWLKQLRVQVKWIQQADPKTIQWSDDKHDKDLKTPQPMVFEIGLNRAYPLTGPGSEGVHPNSFGHPPLLSRQQILVVAAIIVVGMIWLLWLWTSLRKRLKSQWILALVASVAIVATLAVAIYDHTRDTGEPFTVLEGISNWPTVLLRLGVALFCVYALIEAQQADTQNSEQLTGQFGLGSAAPAFHRFREWATSFRISYLAMEVNETDPRPMWARYRWLSLPSQRAARVLGQVSVYAVLCFLFCAFLELPNDPYRGGLNWWTDHVILLIALSLAISLFWYAVDANRLCIRLIHVLADHEIVWPEQARTTAARIAGLDCRSLASESSEIRDALTRSLSRLTTMVILADRTVVIGRLIYFAALAYLLLFLARSPFFDQYVMSFFLILIYTTALLGVFCCGAWLRDGAGRAKREAVKKVHEEIHALRLASSTSEQDQANARASAALEHIAKAIARVRTGAFSPLGDDPVLHTLLMILGGFGALLSLEPIRQFLR